MKKTSPQTPTSTTTVPPTTLATATTDTGASENSTAGTQGQVAGDTDQQAVAPAIVDNYGRVNTDGFHESHGSAVCCLKGGIVGLRKAAAELHQFQAALGDNFHDFARTRLGLTPMMADFLLRVAELGINPEQFTPPVEIKLPEILAVMARVVAIYQATTGMVATGGTASAGPSGTIPSATGTAAMTSTTPAAVNMATAMAGQGDNQPNRE